MATTSLAEEAAKRVRAEIPDEVRRTVLREATNRYNHELLDDEERLLLLDRIRRLRKSLAS